MKKVMFKYMLVCALIFILFPITYSTLSSDKITATDWVYRHSLWIDQYLQGDFTPILEYPPLFHWLMLPFVAFQFPMKYFQIIFAVLSTFGILYYVYKTESRETVIYMAVFMASSIAFIEFSSALMPQSLDYFLFPLILLAYFKDKRILTVLGLIVISLIHITGILFLAILFVHSIFAKKEKMFFILLLMVTILSFYFFYYRTIGVAIQESIIQFSYDYEAQTQWESKYLNPFYNFFFFSGFMTWLCLPIALNKIRIYKSLFDEKLLLYIIWIIIFSSLAIFQQGIWRATSYCIVPLSLLVATVLGRTENNKCVKNEKTKRTYFNEVFG